jgi:hypothetical protein
MIAKFLFEVCWKNLRSRLDENVSELMVSIEESDRVFSMILPLLSAATLKGNRGNRLPTC